MNYQYVEFKRIILSIKKTWVTDLGHHMDLIWNKKLDSYEKIIEYALYYIVRDILSSYMTRETEISWMSKYF